MISGPLRMQNKAPLPEIHSFRRRRENLFEFHFFLQEMNLNSHSNNPPWFDRFYSLKDSITLSRPLKVEKVIGFLTSALAAATVIYIAAASASGSGHLEIARKGITPGDLAAQVCGFAMLLLLFGIGLWIALLRIDFVFGNNGVTITTRFPGRKTTVQFFPWEQFEDMEIRTRGGKTGPRYYLYLKIKNERPRFIRCTPSQEECRSLRSSVMDLRAVFCGT